jgi:hypothetical protein
MFVCIVLLFPIHPFMLGNNNLFLSFYKGKKNCVFELALHIYVMILDYQSLLQGLQYLENQRGFILGIARITGKEARTAREIEFYRWKEEDNGYVWVLFDGFSQSSLGFYLFFF